jgi:hypothetical protein
MVNGITWEEETEAKIKDAREKQMRAEQQQAQAQKEVQYWRDIAETLEKGLKLIRQTQQVKLAGQPSLDSERLLTQSVHSSLIDIALANNGLLTVVEAVSILVNAGVFTDREHARNSIYSNLNHYKKQFKWIRRGIYKYVGTQQQLLNIS